VINLNRLVLIGTRNESASAARVNPLMAHLEPDAEPEPLNLAYRPKKVDPMSLYQPFIDRRKPIPVYELVNLRLRGYDFVVLEQYQRYVHSIVVKLGLSVKESFATAAQTSKTVTYKFRTTAVENEYNLALYERTVQLPELETTKAHLLLEIIRTNLPVGVEFTMKHPDAEDDRVRYLPDLQLREKRRELQELLKSAKKDPLLSELVEDAAKSK